MCHQKRRQSLPKFLIRQKGREPRVLNQKNNIVSNIFFSSTPLELNRLKKKIAHERYGKKRASNFLNLMWRLVTDLFTQFRADQSGVESGCEGRFLLLSRLILTPDILQSCFNFFTFCPLGKLVAELIIIIFWCQCYPASAYKFNNFITYQQRIERSWQGGTGIWKKDLGRFFFQPIFVDYYHKGSTSSPVPCCG